MEIFDLLTFSAIAWLFVGAIFGLIIGAIPGLTAMMAMALLLPVSFTLDPGPAIAALLGCYVGGIAGGLVSAVLLGMPGTTSSIATTFDGYPLAKKGFPVRALGIGTTASFIGGIMGFIVLIALAPVVADIAITLGPPEYFAITVLALVIVGALAGDDLRKGLAAACLGLLVGCIGFAPIDSTERFTFGIPNLWGGIDILPLVIGMFAVSEILRVLITAGRADNDKPMPVKGFGLGFKLSEIGKNWWNILRSGLLGIGIGTLPGMGGTAANLVAYSRAQSTSRNPEAFGKGSPEGIWAPETANSAAVGGALVPTITLGIPGDGVTAVLLGGLMIQGIQPGPLLFDEDPNVVRVIFIFFAIAVAVVYVLQVLGVKVFPKVLSVPRRILFPILIVAMAMGSYASGHRMFDVWMIVVLGVLGYILAEFGFALSPLLLGFILGPIAEVYFRRALITSNGSMSVFYTSPVAIVCLVIAIVSFALTIWNRRRPKKAENRSAVTASK